MNIEDYRSKVTEILDAQRVTSSETNQFAAHYTKATTPRILLATASSNLMRQYDGDYMNDPEEGRYLVDVMIRAAKKCTHPLKEAFSDRLSAIRATKLLYPAYGKCTFLSCWTTSIIKPGEEEGSDSLNHWRFYGDDGRGASLVIPLQRLMPIFPDHLYNVIYGTETRGGGSSASLRPVRKLEDAVKDRLSSARKSYPNAMSDLEEVIQATHPLLFLFKSSEYSAEKEVRSIVHKDGYSPAGGVKFDERDPRQAYVESAQGLISNGSIIHFGPKSDYKFAIEAMGLASNLGINAKVLVSSKPYR